MSVFKSQVTSQLKTRKKFAQVPNELFAANISTQARLTWAYLMSEGPGWDSSVANLARNLGVSRSAATRAVQELREHNMISTRQTKSGTDFTMHTSDQWSVEWIGEIPLVSITNNTSAESNENGPVTDFGKAGASTDDENLSKLESRAALYEVGIQHANTPNTLNTTDRERSGIRVEGSCNFRSEIPDWWHLHFLKGSFYEEGYFRLTPDVQKELRKRFPEADDKDDFLAEMDHHLGRRSCLM